MALALSTWKQVKNIGETTSARDEYKFRVVESNVNSTNHTASYKVQFYGTDTSSLGTYEHYMNAVKLKVNGETVATLLNSKIHMGSGRSSGYTPKYSSSSPYTTSSYTLGPLKTTDVVTVALDSSINTGDTFRYTSESITVSSSIRTAKYTITYNRNGGTAGSGGTTSNITQSTNNSGTFTTKAADLYTAPATRLYTLTLNGNSGTNGTPTYHSTPNAFYRWNDGSNNYEASKSYTVTSNKTLKARWATRVKLGTTTRSAKVTGYTVTFNANGGTCSTASLVQTNTKNYPFKGWNSAKDGSGTAYTDYTKYYSITSTRTYYAQWGTATTTAGKIKFPEATNVKTANLTITFNYQNATGGNTTKTAVSTKTTTKPLKFWGTSTSATSGYAAGAEWAPTSTHTRYAIWGDPTNTYSAINLPTPTRTFYTFKGWATSATATSGVKGTYTPTSDSVKTLYAIWEENRFSITLDNNQGWSDKYATWGPTSGVATKTIIIKQPIKPGWYFINWTDDKGTVLSTKSEYTFTMPSSNIKYTANLAPYTIRINDKGKTGLKQQAQVFVFHNGEWHLAIPNCFTTKWEKKLGE